MTERRCIYIGLLGLVVALIGMAIPSYDRAAADVLGVSKSHAGASRERKLGRDTPHYCETLRPIGVHYQTVITLDIHGKIGTTTVLRERDFKGREVELLRLIAPHVALAYRNAEEYNVFRQAAERTIPTPVELQELGLTARQSEVLHWVIQGKRDWEIGRILSASPRTIQNHVRRILQKLSAETRTGAVLVATDRLKRLARVVSNR
jgi:DNA-binding CsgD family transcriptional regulator